MKKLIIILSFLFCVVNSAQDLSGVKILIYPQTGLTGGKGDSYIKAKIYERLLKNFGAEVIVIEERLPLSQLTAIANNYKVDFLHSIADKNLIKEEDEDYSLVIYNSFENFDIEKAGKLILDGTANSNRVDNKYLSGEKENNLSGNFFFGMNTPGIITIVSQNNPFVESNTVNNPDYLKNEVWGVVRGIMNFYEIKPYRKGLIAGFVKDKNEKLDKQGTNGREVLKPVNNIKVTLYPTGKTYVGDFNNNGFFYFDSLEPGEYKLVYEAGTYSADSSIVTVASNQTTFADKLLEKDFSIPPSVFNYSPHDTSKKVDTESGIKVVFSIPMDRETTQEAFKINPGIDGKFLWSNEDHVLKFIPENPLDTSALYEVIVDTTAKGKNNVNLETQGKFAFKTKRRHVEVVSNSVSSSEDSLVTTRGIEINFSKTMDRSETEDAFEIEPKIKGHFEWAEDNRKMTFVPDEAYSTSTKYKVIIDENAETGSGLELGYDYEFEFVTKSSHIHPEVIAVKPLGISDSIYINTDVLLKFNEPMSIEDFYNAFTIEPAIEGKFEWNSSNTKLRFIPDKLLTPGTAYKVKLLNTAKNIFGIPLKDNYEFEFKTNNRGRLQLVKTYPAANQKSISTSTKLKLEFNYPVDINMLSQNISLTAGSGKEIKLNSFTAAAKEEKYIVYCQPSEVLNKETEYSFIVSKETKDEMGIPLLGDIIITFKTEQNNSFNGDVVEGFEDINKWTKVDSNNASPGIDLSNTYFEISSGNKISGRYSGRVVYKFNKEKASLKLEKIQPLNLYTGGGEAGLWIWGDLSLNLLSVKIINDEKETFDVVIDTLNWSGWKFKKFILPNFAANNNVSLKSITIKHTLKGEFEGEIYLDDLQISKTNELTKAEETLPSEFSLEQNYPNPFNPATTISFKIPASSVVTLDVLNILGQKIRSLIHKESYSAGTWTVEWDGKSDYGDFMPSGVYLYKFSAGDFTEVKKMILIK